MTDLKDSPAPGQRSGWISVEERLPTVDSSHVLVLRNRSSEPPVRTAFWCEERFHNHYKWPMPIMTDVTHWMPLPDPPASAPSGNAGSQPAANLPKLTEAEQDAIRDHFDKRCRKQKFVHYSDVLAFGESIYLATRERAARVAAQVYLEGRAATGATGGRIREADYTEALRKAGK